MTTTTSRFGAYLPALSITGRAKLSSMQARRRLDRDFESIEHIVSFYKILSLLYTVLTSLNDFSVNKNHIELRNKFVSHDGQKKLVVTMSSNRDAADFGDLARKMAEMIQDNVRYSFLTAKIYLLILFL